MAEFISQLRSLFSFGGPTQIGIDIGASAVKVAAVRGSEKGLKLIGAAYEETPNGCVVDGVLGDPRTMVDVVKATLAKAGIKSYRNVPAVVGLRGVGVIFKRLTLPMQGAEEMNAQVFLEAQQQIESDLSEWIVDYQILSSPDSQGQVVVMLVGAKRHVAEDYYKLLELVGLKPAVFDCDIFAFTNILEYSLGGNIHDTVLCLDIGRDSTKFHLVQDNLPVIVRNFPNGGIHLTELIARNLNVDYDQSEAFKISASTDEGPVQPEVENALSTYLEELCGEIQQTLDFFSNSSSDTRIDVIDRVVLSGGGASTKGLADKLADMLRTRVEYMDPFAQVTVPNKVANAVSAVPHIYSVAMGLALRRPGDRT